MTAQTAKQDINESREAPAEAITSGKKAPGAFRTISEVADTLDVQQHVLRFWETKFTQIKPLKRGGGRRYYRPEDVALLKKIHTLLYTEGYTIKGVQKLLKTLGKAQLLADDQPQNTARRPLAANSAAEAEPVDMPAVKTPPLAEITDKQRLILQAMLGDLRDLRNMIAVEK